MTGRTEILRLRIHNDSDWVRTLEPGLTSCHFYLMYNDIHSENTDHGFPLQHLVWLNIWLQLVFVFCGTILRNTVSSVLLHFLQVDTVYMQCTSSGQFTPALQTYYTSDQPIAPLPPHLVMIWSERAFIRRLKTIFGVAHSQPLDVI